MEVAISNSLTLPVCGLLLVIIFDDWERVMNTRAQNFPYTVLLVGVGLGGPGVQCG
jgi:hypothetical protein